MITSRVRPGEDRDAVQTNESTPPIDQDSNDAPSECEGSDREENVALEERRPEDAGGDGLASASTARTAAPESKNLTAIVEASPLEMAKRTRTDQVPVTVPQVLGGGA